MKKLYLQDLEGYSEKEIKKHLIDKYRANKKEIDKYRVVIAYESVGDWGCDSTSFFLLQNKKSKKYYEVHGSHCSCYGFENQFNLEETTIKYLKSKGVIFHCGGYDGNTTKNQKLVTEFIKNI